MKIELHADDLGLSRAVNAGILAALDSGHLDSVSILPNLETTEESIAEIRKRECNWYVHLNIVEGRSLSEPASIPLLAKANGIFRYSFIGLMWRTTFRTRRKKEQWRSQIRSELTRQVDLFRHAFQAEAVRVDSHEHTHLIPLVFDVICELAQETRVQHVRLVQEPIVLPPGGLWRASYWVNLCKALLLNALSRRAQKRLALLNTTYNRNLIGVLHSGRMNTRTIAHALGKIRKGSNSGNETVQILFHPAIDSGQKRSSRTFFDFTSGDSRESEYRVLTSREFRQLISRTRKI